MRTLSRMLCGGLLGAALSLFTPQASFAQYPGGASGGGAASPTAEAKKRINELQAGVNTLKAEQKKMRDGLRAEFAEKEEWKDVLAKFKKAKAAYDKAQKAALAKVKAKPEYKQLLKERDALKLKLDGMQENPSSDVDDIAKVGTELTEKGLALKKLDMSAVTEDEEALAAKEAYDAARKEMQAFEEEVEDALFSDPDFEANQTKLDAAEQELATAREQLAQQRKSAQRPSRSGGAGPGSGMPSGGMKGMGKKGKGKRSPY